MMTTIEKKKLILLGLQAFRHCGSLARAAGEAWDDKGFDTWRRQQVDAACGKAGLRECDHDDYNAVAARFYSLMGRDDLAMGQHLRALSAGERTAHAVLSREIEASGLGLNYVEAISRSQFGRDIKELGERQAWFLVYTVRNRAAARRKKALATADAGIRENEPF